MKTFAAFLVLVTLAAVCVGCGKPNTDSSHMITPSPDDLPAIIDTLPRDTGTVDSGSIDIDDLPMAVVPGDPAATSADALSPTTASTVHTAPTESQPSEETPVQPTEPTAVLSGTDPDGYQNVVVRP